LSLTTQQQGIVFFDGHCGLCDSLVTTLMRVDVHQKLLFAPLQGLTAKEKLSTRVDVSRLDTVLYLRGQELFTMSDAVLQIFCDLGAPWSAAKIFYLIPRVFRDFAYRFVAKHRFSLIPRRTQCRLPTPAEQDHLLP
jgi:predicted DCC family thiol-disulfide oxidoreductase YuxK